MPIKKSESITDRTEQVFSELEKTSEQELKRLQNLPKRTTTISCRILKSEKERIENIVNQKGFTLAQALKQALYDFIEK